MHVAVVSNAMVPLHGGWRDKDCREFAAVVLGSSVPFYVTQASGSASADRLKISVVDDRTKDA